MRNMRGILALTFLGGYFVWRNRFAVQRQLESFGIKTPLFKGSISEAAKSVASRVSGKMDHGATIAERKVNSAASGF